MLNEPPASDGAPWGFKTRNIAGLSASPIEYTMGIAFAGLCNTAETPQDHTNTRILSEPVAGLTRTHAEPVNTLSPAHYLPGSPKENGLHFWSPSSLTTLYGSNVGLCSLALPAVAEDLSFRVIPPNLPCNLPYGPVGTSG